MNDGMYDIIKETVYLFYPKGIDAVGSSTEYLNSNEYKKLLKDITYFKVKQPTITNELVDKICKGFPNKKFVDATLFDWEDRCYNYQFYQIIDNKIYSICLNISILFPIFTTYLVEVIIKPNSDIWESMNVVTNISKDSIFYNEIQLINGIVQSNLNLTYIEFKNLNEVFEDLSFQDVGFGEFTLFNAYFLNEVNIRL